MVAPAMPPQLDTRFARSLYHVGAGTSANRLQFRCACSLGRAVLCAIFFVALVLPVAAGANPKDQMHSLDEQVQEVKADILSIAAELNHLEEKLLYPSNTHVAVFVSVAEDQGIQLDSAQIRIDGELVARHVYSFKELEALKRGGVQRIYTGNIQTGDHQLEVSMAGKRPNGSDYAGTKQFSFHKNIEPKLVEVTLAGHAVGDAQIRLGTR